VRTSGGTSLGQACSAAGRTHRGLAGIGILSAAVAAVLFVVGRIHMVNPALSLSGRQYLAAAALKSKLEAAAVTAPMAVSTRLAIC
jgi:hypothetical protein